MLLYYGRGRQHDPTVWVSTDRILEQGGVRGKQRRGPPSLYKHTNSTGNNRMRAGTRVAPLNIIMTYKINTTTYKRVTTGALLAINLPLSYRVGTPRRTLTYDLPRPC